ncbi:SH3 domain-containing protein [Lachancea thermotolerans]|uniref:KLTH0G02332p n=1 Tax=Lachancea thermotolerans (strain ATCC 56472 / CBS 6340 / NRRL Y-8284) TaxID=559295 RepID=C5DLP2_LACTC|nr:KLTH0G02332p [Lachancea thermotolerans CBS 6340]CAR24703.1 KLTH0G02332p [Lachancea thermotolerans CBS 6340]
MSASSINRSLSTVRTELEFLRESDVITENSYRDILSALPERYDPSRGPQQPSATQGEFVEAIYAFQAQQDGDLNLQVGDKVEVLEKPSPEWFKGKCNGRVGMFPSNYVKPAFSGSTTTERPVVPPPPQYQSQQLVPQQTNASAQSAYSQPPFPPSSTNYYQPPPQQYPQQYPQQQYYQAQQAPVAAPVAAPAAQQGHSSQASSAFKKFGGKLGNAAVFGAGATIGSDIVNSIF